MAELLLVLYSRQQADGYCLPACVQMVLAYWGIHRNQDDLARVLGVVDDFGAPASNIVRLRTAQMIVVHTVESTLADVQRGLEEGVPVIAYVQTSPLSYWQGHQTQHAVLIVGLDDESIYVLDPAQMDTPIAVPIDEFILAWDEMAFTLSYIRRAHSA